MTIIYRTYATLPPKAILDLLLDLLTVVFVNQSREEWLADLTEKATHLPPAASMCSLGFQVLLACDADQVVGCKIGYAWQQDISARSTFYSWLGGVAPAYRGLGIAGELMRRQHEACRAAGYVVVRTHTYNQWRDMLILNLRHGFQITGTQPGKHGLTIVLEKALGASALAAERITV